MTLVDRRNFHLFQPLLYQVATGALSPGEIAQPLRSILRKQRNTTVILGEATRHRPGAARGHAVGRRADRLRHAGRRDRAPGTATSATTSGRRRARAQDHRGRDRDPAPDPHRVRGRRARGRSRARARVDDVRHRRRRADRRRAGRRARRDRRRHAQARLPLDPTRRTPGSCWSRRWTGSCRRTRRSRSASGAAAARAAGRHRADEDAGDRHRRAPGPGRHRPTGEESIPTRTVLWAAGVMASTFARTVAEGRRRRDRPGRPVLVGPDLTLPGHPGDLRGRRRGGAAVEGGQAHAGRRAGGDAGRVVRGRRSSAGASSGARTSRSATATTATSRSSGGCRGSPTSAGSGRSGGRAASRPGCCGWASTSRT